MWFPPGMMEDGEVEGDGGAWNLQGVGVEMSVVWARESWKLPLEPKE